MTKAIADMSRAELDAVIARPTEREAALARIAEMERAEAAATEAARQDEFKNQQKGFASGYDGKQKAIVKRAASMRAHLAAAREDALAIIKLDKESFELDEKARWLEADEGVPRGYFAPAHIPAFLVGDTSMPALPRTTHKYGASPKKAAAKKAKDAADYEQQHVVPTRGGSKADAAVDSEVIALRQMPRNVPIGGSY